METEPGAVAYLKNLSKKNTKLTVVDELLPNISTHKAFSVVICEMVLHFLNKDEVKQSIVQMQKHTRFDGLNVISSYVEQDSIHQDERMVGYFSYLLKPGELDQWYKDWDILYNELKVNKMGHKSIRFIARRK